MIKTNLGRVVRELREDRDLSLRALAEQSGFSAAFLSQVENGLASPSISSLGRIAQALGVSLGEFFRVAEQAASTVVRAHERPGLDSEWSKAQIEVLGTIRPGREIEGIIVTLHPGGSSSKNPHPQAHEQIAFVVHGAVELTLAEQQHQLSIGDAVTLLPGTPHRWSNVSDQPVQILIVSAC